MYLSVIDRHWMNHIDEMQYLREKFHSMDMHS
ncbi:MAG: hypothetical protein H6765_01980 [Candidatus Peribacteria bacterium]|nr:MAG: hypothetical protein H6765_01980 [Candidatus Peribacteria bacterium]